MAEIKDTPGVIAPPPLIFLAGLFSGLAIHWFWPLGFTRGAVSYVVGAVLVVVGLAAILAVRTKMARAETNIEPWKPTTAILKDGLFGWSRNPVYVAMIVIYIGFTVIAASLWPLIPLVAVLLVMHFGVILREERYLERKFGEQYLNYKGTVRRWI